MGFTGYSVEILEMHFYKDNFFPKLINHLDFLEGKKTI